MPGESDLEKKIVRLAEFHGCYVRKFNSGHAGVPDRVIVKNLTLFLEIKDAGKKPTPLQRDEITTICRAGGFATWVDDYEDAIKVLQGLVANRADWLKADCMERNYWMGR